MENMQINPVLTRTAIARNFNTAERIDIPPYEAPTREQDIPSGELLLVPISFAAIVWMLLFFMHFNFWKSVRHRISSIQSIHQLPCTNCKYFKNNPYLKCAVQPDKVLRTEASSCPDYSANENAVSQ